MSNKEIIEKDIEDRHAQLSSIALKLGEAFPGIDKETILKIYHASISIHQSNQQNSGSTLEKYIESVLDINRIQYKSQVSIDHNGKILGYRIKKRCFHVVDIVIGDVTVGSSITDYTVLSCKKTCRERWTQDNWSLTHPPKKFILITMSADYPSSGRFEESVKRKIITCKSKAKDDRKYKLTFDSLLDELV
jgi:hypothetical protein